MATTPRRPERNPVEKRVEWLAKHYPRSVVADALAAWAEANGQDHLAQLLSLGAIRDPIAVVLRMFDTALEHRPELRTTIFDAYLPWAAKILNDYHKRLLRAHRANAARSPDNHFLQVLGRSPDFGDSIAVHRTAGRLGTAFTLYEAGAYSGIRDMMLRSFGVIAKWAAATHTDLGQLGFYDARDAAMAWLEVQDATSTGEGQPVVYAWPDGWTIRELITKADRAYEGRMMGHCVEDYDSGDSRLFSLRDPKNKPHVTMEWAPIHQFVEQLRGKGNAMPKPEYTARVAEFRNQVFPTHVPAPLPVSPSDTVRATSKFFDGRYLLPRDVLMKNTSIEVWNGHVYVGIDDVDEDMADKLAVALPQASKQYQSLVQNYWPREVISVEIPPWYEWWFARRGPGMGLLDNEDELVQAIRRAVDDAQGEPIFAALRKPTGKRMGG